MIVTGNITSLVKHNLTDDKKTEDSKHSSSKTTTSNDVDIKKCVPSTATTTENSNNINNYCCVSHTDEASTLLEDKKDLINKNNRIANRPENFMIVKNVSISRDDELKSSKLMDENKNEYVIDSVLNNNNLLNNMSTISNENNQRVEKSNNNDSILKDLCVNDKLNSSVDDPVKCNKFINAEENITGKNIGQKIVNDITNMLTDDYGNKENRDVKSESGNVVNVGFRNSENSNDFNIDNYIVLDELYSEDSTSLNADDNCNNLCESVVKNLDEQNNLDKSRLNVDYEVNKNCVTSDNKELVKFSLDLNLLNSCNNQNEQFLRLNTLCSSNCNNSGVTEKVNNCDIQKVGDVDVEAMYNVDIKTFSNVDTKKVKNCDVEVEDNGNVEKVDSAETKEANNINIEKVDIDRVEKSHNKIQLKRDNNDSKEVCNAELENERNNVHNVRDGDVVSGDDDNVGEDMQEVMIGVVVVQDANKHIEEQSVYNPSDVTSSINISYNNELKEVKGKFKMHTSTPLHGVDENASRTSSINYVSPARNILKQWKPLNLLKSKFDTIKENETEDEFSSIQNLDRDINETIKTNSCDCSVSKLTTINNPADTSFEEECNSLVDALENNKVVEDDNNFCEKLKLYHDQFNKENEKNDEGFEKILSEISNFCDDIVILDEFVDTIVHDNNATLITINDSDVSDDNLDDQTIVVNKTFNKNKKDEDSCEQLSLNLDYLKDVHDENLSNDCDNLVNCDKINENNVKILNSTQDKLHGNNSCDVKLNTDDIDYIDLDANDDIDETIICLNEKEFTLDEEDALLGDGNDDVLSISCSDILTPRSTVTIISQCCDDSQSKSEESNVLPIKNDVALLQFSVPDSPRVDKIIPHPSTSNTNDIRTIAITPSTNEVEIVTIDDNQSEMKSDNQDKIKYDRNAPFISSDPRENEDNNDPEWEHLRRLNSDKERYKALRERWRSVVIPDPHLDLTSQNYRLRRISENKNKHSSDNVVINHNSRKRQRNLDDSLDYPNCKRMKCTQFFDTYISQVMRKSQHMRYEIQQQMSNDLRQLARRQELDVRMQFRFQDLRVIHELQMREVVDLKLEYNNKLAVIQSETQKLVNALNLASAEVETFHRFYQDLDNAQTSGCSNSGHNQSSIYLTDSQLNQLFETEHMLELYNKFYV